MWSWTHLCRSKRIKLCCTIIRDLSNAVINELTWSSENVPYMCRKFYQVLIAMYCVSMLVNYLIFLAKWQKYIEVVKVRRIHNFLGP